MATILLSPESAVIDANTVSESVGLCYFDPETETLLELDTLPDMFLSVEPDSYAIRKFYMVTDPVDVLSYAKISLISSAFNSETYSVKTIVSAEEPPFDAFSVLPVYNSFTVTNPPQGDFLSVWILIENISKVNEIIDIDIELEYE